MAVFLIYFVLLLYWEVVFHIGCFGLSGSSPWLMLVLLSIIASIQAILTGWVETKHKRKVFWIFCLAEYIVFAVQTVYFTIFRQPLQLKAMLMGGQDALSNYWREALMGIVKASPILGILTIPLGILIYFFYREKWAIPVYQSIQKIRIMFVMGVSFLVYWMTMEVGEAVDAEFYHEYTEFYDPTIVMQDAGVVPMVQRDMSFEMELIADELLAALGWESDLPAPDDLLAEGAIFNGGMESEKEESVEESVQIPEIEVAEPTEDIPVTQEYHEISLDMEKLGTLSADSSEKRWLAEYFTAKKPSKTNQYTGIFEGYNLIYITAEGFSTYAIDAELTPTLYKLANSGFVCTNYYVPLWQTSTSDGEYVNLTGLIPDGQFSMTKSAQNHMAYALPAFFGSDGCVNMAYHNNTLSYYDRHLSHPNLGYDFKASKLGELDEAQWGDKIFYMDNPGRWPASDLEMMQYTVPEYLQAERFNVYYMTVSGHMYYSFTGNSMSSKNRDAVAGLDMTENARAYIACHIELDKALEHLLKQLEDAGKLDNTVIVLSADHYPYAMTQEQYNELAGRDLSGNKDNFRNSLILWSGSMKESVMITKPCYSADILPTLLNLFGFEYDSRMYAGRDILSEEPGLVIFNDRSFVSDTVIYDRKSKTTTWRRDLTEEEKEIYLNAAKQEVKERYNFSAYMLRQDYYDVLKQCEIE